MKLATQRIGCGDEHRAQRVHRSSLGLDGADAGHPQHADRLYRSISELGYAACFARQYGSCRRFGVDRVAFAALASQASVRAWYLEHLHVLLVQVAGEPGPVGAGSFDTNLSEFAVVAH